MTRRKRPAATEAPITSRTAQVSIVQHHDDCGAWVQYRILGTRGRWTYVRCPACGQKRALDLKRHTKREVGS